MGEVPKGKAMRRSGAKVGDDIWVSGIPGMAALGLAYLQGKTALPEEDRLFCLAALHKPQPQVALGLALRDTAHSAIDVSDGLLADLGHILECSKVGAEIQFDAIPKVSAGNIDTALLQQCVLSGGDDYELCFTAPLASRAAIEAISQTLQLPLTRIGLIRAEQGCVVRTADGGVLQPKESGYDHFK
jgi:thiamine-monophosphate kinase